MGMLFKIASWFLGIVFLLCFFIFLTTGILSAIAALLLAALFLPPIWSIIENKSGVKLNRGLKAILIIFLFFTMVFAPRKHTATVPPTPNADIQTAAKPEVKEENKPPVIDESPESERVPDYEVVREDYTDGHYSAVVYTAETDDYLIENLISDFKSKGSHPDASLLIFSKNDKALVEQNLDSENDNVLSSIASQVRAEYHKNNSSEELLYYPNGLNGDKLALAIK